MSAIRGRPRGNNNQIKQTTSVENICIDRCDLSHLLQLWISPTQILTKAVLLKSCLYDVLFKMWNLIWWRKEDSAWLRTASCVSPLARTRACARACVFVCSCTVLTDALFWLGYCLVWWHLLCFVNRGSNQSGCTRVRILEKCCPLCWLWILQHKVKIGHLLKT